MMRKFKLEMFMQNLKFSFINLAEHCDKGYASGELKRATRALIPEKFPFSKKQTQGKFNKIIEILNDLYILLAQTLETKHCTINYTLCNTPTSKNWHKCKQFY